MYCRFFLCDVVLNVAEFMYNKYSFFWYVIDSDSRTKT